MEPQLISKRDTPVAALIPITDFRRYTELEAAQVRPTMAELLREVREIDEDDPIIPERRDRDCGVDLFNPFTGD